MPLACILYLASQSALYRLCLAVLGYRKLVVSLRMLEERGMRELHNILLGCEERGNTLLLVEANDIVDLVPLCLGGMGNKGGEMLDILSIARHRDYIIY